MRITEDYVFFWGSCFSQWSKETDNEGYQFVGDNGIKFSSAEKYMMYQKAVLFGDEKMKEKISKSNNASKIKDYGKQVKGFTNEIWDKNKYQIVLKATFLKFSQNPSLLDEMLKHKGKIFVEASPKDDIWGIKLHWEDDRVLDPKKWKGQNLLGKALTETMQFFLEGNK